ncbi:hypothetical protein D6D06_10137 [Aureobasidium pullulans]|nr:hypothetical protein D6D06_10137 [Aureobasidium pullulans]THX83801.1 hypothetical protein D6D05_03389 [Aureobasidium pullulans]
MASIFDNDKDFDIIIHFGEHKFHAHRIILRVMSTFFDRALTSQFAVAQNPVLELGDDDDAEAVWAMFRHMYNIDYFYDPASTNARSLDFHVAVFTVADKYDCPLLRKNVVDQFGGIMHSQLTKNQLEKIVRFADKVADVCLVHFNKLICSDVFAEALTKGSLFDDRGATKLLVYVLGTSGMNLTQGTLAGKTLTIAAAKLIPK